MINESETLIVVVDDDERVCRALERVLACHGYRVRTFTSARAYLAARERMTPACVVADIRMPELDGLALHEAEQALGADVPTVFMTASGDVATTVRAMKAGASDFLEKPFDDRTLLAAVEAAVARGEQELVERRALARVWRHLQYLTPREAEVGALVISGRLNKQIAATIGTTEKTVKVHRARVMQKMGVTSLADLVRVIDHALRARSSPSITEDGAVLARPRALAVIERVLGLEPGQTIMTSATLREPSLADVADVSEKEAIALAGRTMDQGAMPGSAPQSLT